MNGIAQPRRKSWITKDCGFIERLFTRIVQSIFRPPVFTRYFFSIGEQAFVELAHHVDAIFAQVIGGPQPVHHGFEIIFRDIGKVLLQGLTAGGFKHPAFHFRSGRDRFFQNEQTVPVQAEHGFCLSVFIEKIGTVEIRSFEIFMVFVVIEQDGTETKTGFEGLHELVTEGVPVAFDIRHLTVQSFLAVRITVLPVPGLLIGRQFIFMRFQPDQEMALFESFQAPCMDKRIAWGLPME
jgi:hypothetical protein